MTERNEQFLRERFGYQAIEDYFNQEPKVKTINECLEGTLIGDFSRKGYGWKSRWPTAPTIYRRNQFYEQAEAKAYLTAFTGMHSEDNSTVRNEILKREYFLSSANAFNGKKGSEVKLLLEQIKSDYFPDAEFSFNGRGRFLGLLSDSDLALIAEGSIHRDGKKLILVSFNLSEEKVETLNNIARAYNSKVNAEKHFAGRKK